MWTLGSEFLGVHDPDLETECYNPELRPSSGYIPRTRSEFRVLHPLYIVCACISIMQILRGTPAQTDARKFLSLLFLRHQCFTCPGLCSHGELAMLFPILAPLAILYCLHPDTFGLGLWISPMCNHNATIANHAQLVVR